MNTRLLSIVSLAAALTLGMTGCAGPSGASDSGSADGSGGLRVVTTFSILEDIVNEVGGADVSVHSIVPLGTDPHEYQPLPQDVAATSDADLIVWNGLNMELGDGWLENLLDSTDHSLQGDNVIEASLGVEPMYLTAEKGSDHEVNPHAFLDPNAGMVYTKNIRDGLIAADPANADAYSERAAAYLEELEEIDQLYKDTIASIDPEHRTLVTSENAFQYMNERYGLTGLYIWAIDTGDLGSPEQISKLVQQLKASTLPALFVESNVDTRPMETVSDETGVPIFGEVFSDELGDAQSTGASYTAMLRSNIAQIGAGLGATVTTAEKSS